nr:hypothetical protein [Luteibacter rhizovicinus]
MIWSRWSNGPESPDANDVFVSVTRFRAFRLTDLPRIALAGFALKRHWRELPGAIGTWLWVDIGERSSGSVSVWRAESDMRRFVRWPPHVEIVKRYRATGVMSSTAWVAPRFDPSAVRREAAQWLTGAATPSE